MFWDTGPSRAMREGGVPVYRDIEAVVDSLARLVALHERRSHGVPDIPEPAPPIAGDGYFEARELLAASGIPFAAARRAGSVDEARAAASELGYPAVLKALGLLHKSDVGGVALGLADDEAVAAAARDMHERLAPEGYSVETLVPTANGVELVVGCRREPRFGPVVLVGVGGIYAELIEDVAIALAPAGADELEHLLRSLRVAGLLTGARGREPVDVRAAAEAAAALSRLAAAHPEIAEIEINPLLVTLADAVALDARLILD
jgi:acyl-CoA synthetase (NDP forming)